MDDLRGRDFHTSWVDKITNSADGFLPSDLDFHPNSIITIAMPCPKVTLTFIFHGKEIPCVLPPGYAEMYQTDSEILAYLNDFLSAQGYKASTANGFPQKLLAVRCGLALYGRNNIAYHEEFGSFMSLSTFVSDLPCDEHTWLPARRMEPCENCRACIDACPTKAIAPERLIIDADICLTSLNEGEGKFPDWLDKSAHNCIIGCMKCQECCPQNAKNNNYLREGIVFTEEETTEILSHTDGALFNGVLMEKINYLGLAEYPHLLARNLQALLK
jgi:epoxyqueuosine reductase